MPKARFVIKEAPKGYTFRLVAANNEIIGVSQVYASLETTKTGIASVQKNAPIANVEDQTASDEKAKTPKFEIYLDKAGEFRFRLVATNGQNILASEGYKAKASCKNGIESVRKSAPAAEIQEPEKPAK